MCIYYYYYLTLFPLFQNLVQKFQGSVDGFSNPLGLIGEGAGRVTETLKHIRLTRLYKLNILVNCCLQN